MEADGSITKYYPFVTNDTRDILESIMKRATNYYEFALKLGEYVTNVSSSDELAFIAAVHAWRIQEQPLLMKIRERYSESPGIIALTYPTISLGDRYQFGGEVGRIIDYDLKAELPDWVRIKLLLHRAYFCNAVLPSSEAFETLEKIGRLIERNSDLECFRVNEKLIESVTYSNEGDNTNALLSATKGLELARKYNHPYLTSSFLRAQGNLLRNLNPAIAFGYLEESNALINKLGVPQRMHEVRNELGLTCLVLGELDLALESFLSSLEVYETSLGPDDTTSLNISRLYAEMGNYLEALEWIKTSFDYHRGKGFSMMYSLKAEILIRLKRFDEIEELLDQAQKLAIASGSELGLGQVKRVQGIFEASMQRWPEAMSYFEEAHSYFEQLGTMLFINQILFELAKCEMEQAIETGIELDETVSGPWMTRLIHHAEKFKLPGIAMRAAILKAKFLKSREMDVVAREILEEALGILDSPSVQTIRNEIKDELLTLR